MKKIKRLSITVATIIYNEEENILKLIRSILSQKNDNYNIKEILVISDGSTDRSVKLLKTIGDKRLRVFAYKTRVGKSQHLNTLFSLFKGNILVLFDGDVILSNARTISNLIKPLTRNKHTGLVGGNPLPIHATTFIENAVNTSFAVYAPFRNILKNGNNAYGCDGRILALSRNFAKSTCIPKDMIANDAYMYFACITKGFTFNHVNKAIVWFRSPANLSDQIRQNKRFIAARYRLTKLFGTIVDQEYSLPRSVFYKLLLIQFIKHPVYSSVIFIINSYCRFKARAEEKSMNALWPIAFSTKSQTIQ